MGKSRTPGYIPPVDPSRLLDRRIRVAGETTVSARIAVPPSHAPSRSPLVLLAHGAGSDMHHPSLAGLRDDLADRGWAAATFNFPYRERGSRLPDRAPALVRCYRSVAEVLCADGEIAPPWIVLGGRSMGGRMASLLAAEQRPDGVRGLLLLAFPLHPAGKPSIERARHLDAIDLPMLFVQGTRDALADRTLLDPLLARLPRATCHDVVEGDHGFRVPRRTGRTAEDVRSEVTDVVGHWLASALVRSSSKGTRAR